MELSFSTWITETLYGTFLDPLMTMITRLGDGGFVWLILISGLLLFRKTRRCGIVCLVALILILLSGNLLLKNLFDRPRPYTHLPDLALLIPTPHDAGSFPSGHAGSSFAVAVSLFLYHRRWGVCALVLAALISLSRVYLIVHYPTDILGGMLLGIACALLARWLVDCLVPDHPLVPRTQKPS